MRMLTLLQSAARTLVGAWYAWRLARIKRRLDQIDVWRQYERAQHAEQMEWLRAEEAQLCGALEAASDRAIVGGRAST